jgi:hypothetical protein
MSLARDFIRSRKTHIVLGVAALYIGFRVWEVMAAPHKVVGDFPERRRVDALVVLSFAPERFHITKFQEFGRVSGTNGNVIEVRGVLRSDLNKLAQPYWVQRVEPAT